MGTDKIKVYTYTRVSTAMQVDGYSLDAQKTRMKAFADYNDYKIGNRFNYECWLTFDRVRGTFSKIEYEVRFCQSPHERVILFN